MTDKEIIWDTLKLMLKITIKPENVWVDIKHTFWNGFSEEKQIRLRRLLLINTLIGLNDSDQWKFKLTAQGIVANESDFKNNGVLKKRDKQFIKTLIITLAGVIVGAGLSYLQQWAQSKESSKNQPTKVILVHNPKQKDTIYVRIKN